METKTVIKSATCKQRERKREREWQPSDQEDNNPPPSQWNKAKIQQLATVLWGTLTLTLINKQVQKPEKSLERLHLEIRDKLEVLSPQSVEELWFLQQNRRLTSWGLLKTKRKNMFCIVTIRVKLGWVVGFSAHNLHGTWTDSSWANAHAAGLLLMGLLYWISILKHSKYVSEGTVCIITLFSLIQSKESTVSAFDQNVNVRI